MDNEQWLADKNFVRIGDDAWQQLGCSKLIVRRFQREAYVWRASINGWFGYGDDVPAATADAITTAEGAIENTVTSINAARGLLEPPSGTNT